MYLRTYTRKNKNGTIAKYYQLAENRPHPETGKPVPVIIHNFGRADRVDRKEFIRLCRSLSRACGNDIHESLSENKKNIKNSNKEIQKQLNSAREECAEIRKTVKNLQENEEKYKSIFENATDQITYLSLDGRVVEVNDRCLDLYGYKREDCIGKHFSEIGFAVSENMGKYSKSFQGMVGGSSLPRLELKAITADGKTVYIETNSQLIQKDGVALGVLSILRDITDRRVEEKKMIAQRDELENMVKERTKDLEEANMALKALLKRRSVDNTELEERMVLNVKELVLPYIEKLSKSGLKDSQKNYAEISLYNLNDIISPFVQKLSSKYYNFTPTEIRIADLIKQGKITKEISQILIMSVRTIDNHRYSIRKKLKLNNTKTNLTTHLQSL